MAGGGEMTQILYAYMNKRKKKNTNEVGKVGRGFQHCQEIPRAA
jgi:hypothetical protein